MRAIFVAFASDDGGATAIEYGLIAGLIAVGCILGMTQFGGSLMSMFNMIRDEGGGAMDAAGLSSS